MPSSVVGSRAIVIASERRRYDERAAAVEFRRLERLARARVENGEIALTGHRIKLRRCILADRNALGRLFQREALEECVFRGIEHPDFAARHFLSPMRAR